MKLLKRTRLALAIPKVLVFVLFYSSQAIAAEEGNGFSGLDTNSIIPPNFLSGGSDSLKQVFVSCKNPMSNFAPMAAMFAGGFSGGASSIPAGFIGMGSNCPEAPDSGETSSLSCSAFSAGDRFSPKMVRDLEKRLNESLVSYRCKKMRFEAIRGEMDCLKKQTDQFIRNMQQFQKAYLDNIQRWQKDVTKLKTIIKDREEQFEEIIGKLRGNSKTGEVGLINAEDRLTTLINAMPNEIEGIRTLQSQAEQQKKALEEQVQSRTVALTGACFRESVNATHKCSPTGKPVSAYEYVLCRYEQNQMLDKNFRQTKDERKERVASSKRQALQSLLDGIFGEIPKSPSVPKTPQEAQQAVDQPLGVLSVEDIETRYGSSLKSFNEKGLNIYAFVMKAFVSCQNKSTRLVQRERLRAGSLIGVAQFALKETQKKISVDVNNLLNRYEQGYKDSLRVLTGEHVPMNLSPACRTGEPSFQLNCLNNTRKLLDKVLKGGAPESAARISIAAPSGSVPAINFQCQGISGCVSRLQKESKNVEKEISRVRTFKESYIQQANQSVDQFTQQMASNLSQPSKFLNEQLDGLNSTLATLGVGASINVEKLDPETLQKDADGLYLPPKNATNLIGSQAQPPLPNLTAQSFQGALSAIASKLEELEGKIAKAQDTVNQIPEFITGCIQAEFRKLAADLQQEIDRLSTEACGTINEHCGNASALSQLTNAISDISNEQGVDQDVVTSLNSGLSIACPGGGGTGEHGGDGLQEVIDLEKLNHDIEALQNQVAAAETKASEMKGDLEIRKETLNLAEKALSDCKLISLSKPGSGTDCNEFENRVSEAKHAFRTANKNSADADSDLKNKQTNLTKKEAKVDTLEQEIKEKKKLRTSCNGIFGKALYKANELKNTMHQMQDSGSAF